MPDSEGFNTFPALSRPVDKPPAASPQGILDHAEQSVEQVRLDGAEADAAISPSAKRRLLAGGAALVALVALPYVVTPLSQYRPWGPGDGYVPFWNVVGRELLDQGQQAASKGEELAELQKLAEPIPKPKLEPAAIAAKQPEPERAVYPAYKVPEADLEPPKTVIVGAEALRHYFERLTLVEMRQRGVVARAGHWGDSVLGNDGVTSAIRRRLQARFGDAGHGFHVLGRYNLAYRHQGVWYRDRGGWNSCEIIFKCRKDGYYGYGGVTSQSSGGGTSRWRTTKEGFGSRVSRFEFWYMKQPDGGQFQLKVDGEVERVIDTSADELQDGFEIVELEDGPHEFEVRAIGKGSARGFGVVLEREGPGVVWDGLALIGSFTQRLDYQDPEHIANQMKHRKIDLMVFMLGGNDVQRQKMDLVHTMQPYEDEYAAVIRKFRAGRPQASCMIMSLVDHGERVGRHGIRTLKIVPKLVESQKKVALAEGCAFFNTFEAMGGEGSIARWYHARPQLAGADFAHPTSEGHEVIAALLYQSLMSSYAEFRQANVGQEFPALAELMAAASDE